MDDFRTLRDWMARNARPLDFARWRFHFGDGSREDVLAALAAYQNPDGGFGHALEADSWNPASTPLQSSTAVAVLQEVGCPDRGHPVVLGLLRYLDSGADFEGGRWRLTVPSNDDFPHAPWWRHDSTSSGRSEFNPTAILVGFLLERADREGALFRKALALAGELVRAFLSGPPLDMHPLLCVGAMSASIEAAGLQDGFDMPSLEASLFRQAEGLIRADADGWAGYACRPSAFIRSPASPLFEPNRDLVDRELDFLLETRNAEGVWNIPWRWQSFEREFAVAENWWKADVAIKSVLHLRAFGRTRFPDVV